MRIIISRIFAIILIGYVAISAILEPTKVVSHTMPAWVDSHMYAPVKHIEKPSSTLTCLAQVLFFEGRNEPMDGLEAIASTVFHRQKSRPSSICAIVYSPAQYSWTADTSKWIIIPPRQFLVMANTFLQNRKLIEIEYPVTHFHRVDVYPKWASTLTYVGTYGQHLFYKTDTL